MKVKKDGLKLEKRTQYRGLGRVARHVGVTPGHLSHVINGKRECSQRLADKLAKIGITPPLVAGK